MAFLTLLARNRLALAGLLVMTIVVVLALITPLLPLADPDVTDTGNRFVPPLSPGAWLGTDHLGRDLLSRLLWGTRLSLAVGFAAAVAALRHAGHSAGDVQVTVPGGLLRVTVEAGTDERTGPTTLHGPAVLLASGELDRAWWDAPA